MAVLNGSMDVCWTNVKVQQVASRADAYNNVSVEIIMF